MPRWLIGVLTIGVLATALGWLGGPTPPRLDASTTGDTALAESVRGAIADPDGYRGLAVALIEPEGVRFAGLGQGAAGSAVDSDTAFEIGSVGKALTGMLLAELAADGTVDPDESLAALLPHEDFADPDVAQTTLAELASHRSGLPRIRLTGLRQVLEVQLRSLRGADPYATQDTDWLRSTLASASAASGDHDVDYSNYGIAVLGDALAQRAGVAYPELVSQRVLSPLGMTGTSYHLDGADPPANSARGATAGGRTMAPWQGSGYAPAGIGIWSTAEDLARLVSAMLAGTAPGAEAATPRFDAGADQRIGYGWFTDLVDGQELTWHDGGTGGFSSFVGFQPATGRGVVVLANTDRDVDALARQLLVGGDDAAVQQPGPGWHAVAVALFTSLAGGLGLLFTALRPEVDRLRLISNGVWAVALPGIAYSLGAWAVIPSLLWAVGVGISVVAVALAARRWRQTPVQAGRYPWLAWTAAALNALVAPVALVWFYA